MRLIIETDASVPESFVERTREAVYQHATDAGFVVNVTDTVARDGNLKLTISKTEWAILARDAKIIAKKLDGIDVSLDEILFAAGIVPMIKLGKDK